LVSLKIKRGEIATMFRRVTTWCVRRAVVQRQINPNTISSRPLAFKSFTNKRVTSGLYSLSLAGGGGILAFFGLDEDARLEKKYSDEVASYGNDFDEELKNTIKRGILDMQKGELQKAEGLFHIALRMAVDMNHQAAITYVYDLMANLALDMGEDAKAEGLFIAVMQRLIGLKGMSQDDNAIVEMALKIASIHGRSSDKKELAEQGYLFCIYTQKEKLSQNNKTAAAEAPDQDTLALYGMSLDQYGQYLMALGKVKAAKVQFEEALDTSLKLTGEWSEQTVNIQNSLATCLSMLGQTEEAENMFADVITKSKGMSSDNLASYLVNRGLHRVQSQLYSQAKRDCTKARHLTKDKDTLQQSDLCLKKINERLINNGS